MKSIQARQEALARQFDRITNASYWPAQVGDANGNMNGPNGTIIVRELTSNGLSAPRNVQPPMVYLPLAPGYNVELEYNKHGQPYIARSDTKNNRAASQSVLPSPPKEPTAKNKSAPLAVVPTNPPSMAISIKSWNPIVNDVFTPFVGIAEEPASAPSAGNMYYAVWFVKSDLKTAEVFYSTARGISDLALNEDDINEALSQKTAGSTPVWAQKLIGGQTAITDNDLNNDGIPLQQSINVSQDALPVLLTVKEQDNVPTVSNVNTIKVTNGTLTDEGSGVVSINTSSGPSFATPTIALDSSAAAGAASTVIRSDSTIAAFDVTNPTSSAPGDSVAIGTAAFAARRDHKHGRESFGLSGDIGSETFGASAAAGSSGKVADAGHVHSMPANPVSFATPSIALDSSAAAGAAGTVIRSDSTIAAFDATAPTTSAVGDSAVVGTAAFAARRDHKHGRESFATPSIALGSSAVAGVATTPIRSDSTIAAFDTTDPTIIARGDAAAVGVAAFAARRDHKHGLTGDYQVFKVYNGSGATANANDVGYLDYDVTNGYVYKTTTTANLDGVAWCVVITGGANATNIYIATRGQVTVKLNANCSIGNFLTTSTTAGEAAVNTLMRAEVFAVALSANSGGAGGTCLAMLLTQTAFVAAVDANDLLSVVGTSQTVWTGTINGVPSATSVVVTTSTGSLNCLTPAASTQLGKLRLWNTTRNTFRLITAVSGSTITTVSSTDSWANTDALTIESQTTVSGQAFKVVDMDLSQQSVIPTLARCALIRLTVADSSATPTANIGVHPLESYANSKVVSQLAQVQSKNNILIATTKIINGVIGYIVVATGGAGTGTSILRINGYYAACP